MVEAGDVLEGIVLEVKEKTAVIKFGNKAIEAKVLVDLKVGERVKVKVKGFYNGQLVLKVLKRKDDSGLIDFRV
ncbi:hypothetical protein Halha_0635 [Halobacteroides halobius DSM 5150]|uniref:S1 motif domain-containing protein n=1 Tax=Halobacteroides halobius (strain ATCC 35273 / DSM 5150 / MD-1) TaxID=748449 RepID=L0K909_HALHC|nr:hypothetical protein [Halobacteroides halobius]AGB40608.1 hypothetical protein Halha_0635 [Halobacteroides halobius DSM 5150]